MLTVTWKEKSPTELLLRTAFTWEETTGSIKCPSLLQQYAFPTEWVTPFSLEFSPNPITGHAEKPSDPDLKLFNLTPTDRLFHSRGRTPVLQWELRPCPSRADRVLQCISHSSKDQRSLPTMTSIPQKRAQKCLCVQYQARPLHNWVSREEPVLEHQVANLLFWSERACNAAVLPGHKIIPQRKAVAHPSFVLT